MSRSPTHGTIKCSSRIVQVLDQGRRSGVVAADATTNCNPRQGKVIISSLPAAAED